MSFGFDANFEQPFFGGETSTSLAAGTAYVASLGGIPYELDTRENPVSHSSVPLLRGAIDDKENTSRATLNPESFWRRTFESWHVGAGQTYFDRVDDSNPWRFRRSRGAYVWDRYKLGMLPETDWKLSTAATNQFLAVAGGFLYMTDGTNLIRTADITVDTPSWTTITGGTSSTKTSIASDGFNVLVADGARIQKTTRGAATKTDHITGAVDEVAYGKGRWIASNDNSLYDITTLVAGGGALPSALFSHPNTDFVWNSFAEGPTALYVGGFSGDKSLIYRLTIKEDGTGLNQPVVAGFLPDGEIIRSMQGYLGFVLIGTSKGVRVGVPGGNGDLTIGAFIPTDTDVRCFEGQERFVWFGWSNFEGVSTGLGRIDMETFSNVDALAPAYASDLMVIGAITADVQSVATFQNLRVFTVSGNGVWAEHQTRLVASAELDTGCFDYGLTDEKLSLYIDSSHSEAHGGDHSFSMSVNGGPFVLLGSPGGDHHHVGTGETRGQEFELRITLERDSVDLSDGPAVRSFAMRSEPATRLTEVLDVPFLIAPDIHRRDGTTESVDSVAQAENIRTLRDTKVVTQYTEGDRAWSVVVVDYQLDEREIYIGSDNVLGINGTCLTRLKVVV